MLFDENEDTVKSPLVSPNDVLDIEISPIIAAKTTSWLNGFDDKKKKSKSPSYNATTKQRRIKRSKNNITTLKQQTAGMKRGDPFLPSVMTDENPIAEYSKKTVTKKPSDCKCKGMGYNCSPSAVLPEEMRQQWGCGMLGKATPTRSSGCLTSESTVITRPIAPCGSSIAENVPMPRTALCGGNCSFSVNPKPVPLNRNQTICWECKTYPCLCFATAQKTETFLPSENDERRKQKLVNKGSCFKTKGNKTRLLINTTNNPSTVKRITCFNKENNIISTSNYSKDSASPFCSMSEDGSYYYESKYNPTFNNSVKNPRNDPYRDRIYMTSGNEYPSSSRVLQEDNGFTPVSRYRHRVRSNRRSSSNMSSSAITTANGPFGDARMFETPHQRLPLSSKQMFMADPQVCYCERCKRRVQLLSKMEALGFPSSSTHPKPPPYPHPPQQRYNPSTIPFPSHSSNRYVPYTPYSYTYPNIPDTGTFTSPEISSPTDDDSIISNRGDNMFRPLISHSNAMDAFSYLDTDQMLDSPLSNSGAIVEDIMELSVKDTVDFFLGLKSPLADTLSSDDLEPVPQNEMFCNIGDDAFSLESGSSLSSALQQDNNEENHFLQPLSPQTQRFSTSGYSDLETASMSQIYSSLISDLEDELKCAIENIPVE